MENAGVVFIGDREAGSPIGSWRQRAVALVSGVALAMLLCFKADRMRACIADCAIESIEAPRFEPIFPRTFEEPQRDVPRKSKDDEMKTVTRPLRLGETMVDVVTSEGPGSRHLYCNLHDDENTSVEAGLAVVRRRGGRLIELRHGGRRNITFQLRGEPFIVDPNRIFTTEGVRQTLSRLSRRTGEVEHAVERFAGDLLSIYSIERADVVIALHNNTDGDYSALSYRKGGVFASDAVDVFIKDGSDPDDFFFVTEHSVFDALRRRGYNVVLQDNRRVTDDGSLSVYCGKSGMRYINVEAQRGHLEQQVAMILALHEVLEELGPARSR
jgi:hypothetical protein